MKLLYITLLCMIFVGAIVALVMVIFREFGWVQTLACIFGFHEAERDKRGKPVFYMKMGYHGEFPGRYARCKHCGHEELQWD